MDETATMDRERELHEEQWEEARRDAIRRAILNRDYYAAKVEEFKAMTTEDYFQYVQYDPFGEPNECEPPIGEEE